MDYLSALVYPSQFTQTADKFDNLVWSYLEAASGLSIPFSNNGESYECVLNLPVNSLENLPFQRHLVRLPISKGILGIRSISQVAGPAYVGGIELSLPSFTGDLGIAPHLENIIGRPDNGGVYRWAGLLHSGSRTGQELKNVWNNLKFDAEERSAFLDESLDGFVLSDDAASTGAGAEDGTLRTRLIQFLERQRYQCVRLGLERHPTNVPIL